MHRAPARGCSCGLYAVKDPLSLREARDPAVLGSVDLWGRIVEHERGFRGEFAYPQRLGLICSFCSLQRRAEMVGEVAQVARVGGGRLLPLCDPHLALADRSGYPIGELLRPSDVLAELLGAYAVDPIDPASPSLLHLPPLPADGT